MHIVSCDLRAATTVGKGKEVQSSEEETDALKCGRLAVGLLADSSKPAEPKSQSGYELITSLGWLTCSYETRCFVRPHSCLAG